MYDAIYKEVYKCEHEITLFIIIHMHSYNKCT